MPKAKKRDQKERHDPLHIQIEKEKLAAESVKPAKVKTKKTETESDDIVDPKTSQRILRMIREQQEELAAGEQEDVKVVVPKPQYFLLIKTKKQKITGP
jgi:essential nuclear protein 1